MKDITKHVFQNTNILLFVILGFAANLYLLYFSFEKIMIDENIWVEAEATNDITSPLEIVKDDGASGGSTIISNGVSHTVLGYAAYSIDVRREGDYVFWGRCYWPAMCSNSFRVRIDNSARVVFGNDALRNAWHWVKGPSFYLSTGRHSLMIWNEERDARLDKILFTIDQTYIPAGFGEYNNSFFDFENLQTSMFLPNNKELWMIKPDRVRSQLFPFFSWQDIKSPFDLAVKLQDPSNKLSKLLLAQLNNPFLKKQIENFNSKTIPSQIYLEALSHQLNNIIIDNEVSKIFDINWGELPGLKRVEKSEEIDIKYKNRLILEHVYPVELGTNLALYLGPFQENKLEKSLINVTCADNFNFQCDLKAGKSDNHNFSLIFNYQDDDNYYSILYNQDLLKILLIKEGAINELSAKNNHIFLSEDKYQHLSITKRNSMNILKLNGRTLMQVSDSSFSGGSVGIGSSSGDIYFDNIKYEVLSPPVFENNFAETLWQYMQNWRIVSGQWARNDWKPETARVLFGKRNDNDPALIAVGEEYWQNYVVHAAIKTGKEDGLGICFNYQDQNNYYLFKWENRKKLNGKQLVKIENGREIILGTVAGGYKEAHWYKLEVRQYQHHIRAFIDNQLIFKILDSTFVDGKIGLWTDSPDKVYFSSIKVSPTSSLDIIPQNKFQYKFEHREQAGLDYCDWYPRANATGTDYLGKEQFDISKRSFNDAIIMNKKTFTGDFSLKVTMQNSLPPGVDTIILLNEATGDPYHRYTIKAGQTGASIFRNDEEIQTERRIKAFNNSFSIALQDQNLSISLDGRTVLKFNKKIDIDNFKIGLGFSGVNEAFIKFSEIIIEGNEVF